MLDAAESAESVGEGGDLAGGPPEDENFEAVVVVEMDVEGADDDLLVVVLQFEKAGDKVAAVMIIDEGEGPGHVAALGPLLLDEAGAEEVADGLGAVGVPLATDLGVEGLEEALGEGDADADERIHGRRASGVDDAE